MKDVLAAAVAHDVKNRLVILGEELSRLAAMSLPPEAQAHVATANLQAMMLTSKLVEWLTVQRASEGAGLRAVPHEEVPELFLEDVVSQALPLAAGRIQIAKEVGDVPGFWFYDPQLVRLAIDSALHNALRFAKSRITLGVRMDAGQLCFFVQDDGPGVSPQGRSQGEFRSAQHGGCPMSDEPGTASTGLGMRLCNEVAQAHKNRGVHGQCTLRDHHSGGAIFELYLP